jgi:mono/diheme cytochrome c family protein
MRSIALILLLLVSVAFRAGAVPEATAEQLDQGFQRTVEPFVQGYCVSCHGQTKPKGDLDLSPYASVESVARDYQRWGTVLERLEEGDMPPKKAKDHPDPQARAEVVAWIRALRTYEAKRNAGDPGTVLARRLSNAEYDYTIRDLTGVDIRPTKEFPIDPANEAGFDNTGESLAMSPALVKKYLEAARRVADHIVLKPEGLAFAPYPVVADTDRDKYAVKRIIDFYKRQRTDYADYFFAAWRFAHRAELGRKDATLADFATDAGISARYLATVWTTLHEDVGALGPIAALQAKWEALPAEEAAARAGCARMRDFVVSIRAKLVPRVPNLSVPGQNNGSQPLVLWKDRQMAANRMRYSGGGLKASTGAPGWMGLGGILQRYLDPELVRRYEATFDHFCATFPDTFFVSERARVYLDEEKEKKLGGRLLSAGFHSQMGYFRDDGPLYELMLDDAQRRELDRLWLELDFITSAPIRQYTGFLWFDRTDSRFMRDAEFDFARAEDKDCTSDEKMGRLSKLYLAKAQRMGAGPVAMEAIADYFTRMRATFRMLEKAHADAEPSHLEAVKAFAERAFRRPLTTAERDGIAAFYRELREKDELGHEDAIRDTVVSVLMSPHFCYRLDLPRSAGESLSGGKTAVQPLDDDALASRLSYFLWSSMPDRELLDLAAAGRLHEPGVMAAQARRMLRDARSRGLAIEFAGNWLDFRRFEEHKGVDRGRFPTFTNDLRQAMFEEPIRFIQNVMTGDASVLDCLYGDYTFVNPVLARHYGMPEPKDGGWARVDGAGKWGRGGLLPMGVFLTNNSPGLRTSPVKRGHWVVKRVLGERIPPPPPNVPELPGDESKLGNLTLRETLARHRADPSCAGCHEKFDSFGLVFEGYGPVGERRETDLGGRAVDSTAVFPGGGDGRGLDGLKAYVRQHRANDFVDNLCRKLLAYGLGRTLMPSDDATVEAMRAKLESNGYRFDGLVETIVTSPQFLNKRVSGALAKE